jgi:pimeloyl-ACP methyl ester carboxylesterase
MEDMAKYDEIGAVGMLADELQVAPWPVVRRVFPTSRGELSGLGWGGGRFSELFLHGGGQNAHTWDSLMLLRRPQALALDLPGHGRSCWYDDALYLPRTMLPPIAEVVKAVSRPLELVVGMSLGAITALALAADFPELVNRLMIVDASPGVQPAQATAITEFISQVEYPDFDSMLARTSAFRPARSRESLTRALMHNAKRTSSGTWTWRADRRDWKSGDRLQQVFEDLPTYWECIPKVQCPVALIVGADSPIVSQADIERYLSLNPLLEVVSIPEAGHNVQGDQSHLLALAVDQFMAHHGRIH